MRPLCFVLFAVLTLYIHSATATVTTCYDTNLNATVHTIRSEIGPIRDAIHKGTGDTFKPVDDVETVKITRNCYDDPYTAEFLIRYANHIEKNIQLECTFVPCRGTERPDSDSEQSSRCKLSYLKRGLNHPLPCDVTYEWQQLVKQRDEDMMKVRNAFFAVPWRYVIAGFLILLYEHAARLHSLPRIATTLAACTRVSRAFFSALGRMAARISSFIYQLRLHEIVDTVGELVSELFHFLTSAVYLVKGYVTQLATYSRPQVVVFGSLVLLGALTLTIEMLR